MSDRIPLDPVSAGGFPGGLDLTALNPRTRINLEQARVLLVDDPQPGVDIMGAVLRGFGVRAPVRCASGPQAAETVQGQEFDLIICDGDLTDGQAYDFVSWLRRAESSPSRFCPVVVLTAHTPHAEVAKARDCGANFVVAKPIAPMALLERILWVAVSRRPFVEVNGYIGPDRRFQYLGPPVDSSGRRGGDEEAVSATAATPNLSQSEIDSMVVNPAKVKI